MPRTSRVPRPQSQSPAARITAAIIEKLEAGTKPWVRPWRGAALSRPLRSCGTPYRGMNVFWLWMVAEAAGFSSPYWMTYRQCAKLGGQVRKGEKSTIAIFYKSYTRGMEGDDGAETRETRRVLKSYAIFNADQCDGLPERYHPGSASEPVEPQGREETLDRFFAAIGANLRHQGTQAYYEPVADRITMPPSTLFEGYYHYYATLAHEHSHNAVTWIMPHGAILRARSPCYVDPIRHNLRSSTNLEHDDEYEHFTFLRRALP
ncbi:ArdC family protein [Novosphingopyxis sp.]|uniref:ArdC family protein n=1 Tax=Novosphingopyxis sp. TaxID=2709690 RepID=UPI003B58BC47